MTAAPRTCWVVHRDGSPCTDAHYGLGMCKFHYKRHKAGWSDEELSLPRGANRFARPCPVIWHDTGEECGDSAPSGELCRFHLARRRKGWSDEELGRPKRVRYSADASCPVVWHDTGVECALAVDSKGMCTLHYERHRRGWSDEELGLPVGACRTSLKEKALCWVVWHDTGVECGDTVDSKGLCAFHYGRHMNGWSDDELGLPKGASRKQKKETTCPVIEDETGVNCPRPVKCKGMCRFHYQRVLKQWPPERLGEPPRDHTRSAERCDLAQLRADRQIFCSLDTTGKGYLKPLNQWRMWLERLAATEPAALALSEATLVKSYITERSDAGLSASTIDVDASAIRWWALYDGRPDPTLGTSDMRRGHRSQKPKPRPAAGELTLDELRTLLREIRWAQWAHHREDPENASRLARAMLMSLLHLAARHSDVARLKMGDLERTEQGWRIVPWKRKNWPGGTPDGLWLVPTKDPLFDPVQAMDEWMEFREPLGDGYVFPLFDGAWHPTKPTAFQQLQNYLGRLGRSAGLGHLTSGVFRRSMTQLLTDQGASESELLRLLGHRDTRTLRRYQTKKHAPSAAEQMVRLYEIAASENEEEADDAG